MSRPVSSRNVSASVEEAESILRVLRRYNTSPSSPKSSRSSVSPPSAKASAIKTASPSAADGIGVSRLAFDKADSAESAGGKEKTGFPWEQGDPEKTSSDLKRFESRIRLGLGKSAESPVASKSPNILGYTSPTFMAREIERLHEEVRDLDRHNKSLVAENTKLRREVESEGELKESYFHEAVGARRHAQKALEDVTLENEEQQRRLGALKARVSDLSSQLDEAKSETRAAEQKFERERDGHQRSQTAHARALDDVAALEARVERLTRNLEVRSEELTQANHKVSELNFCLDVEKKSRAAIIEDSEQLRSNLERAWQKALDENEAAKDKLRKDMLLLKDAHETTREKERKQFERSLAESDKLHLATQSTLKTELGEARTRLKQLQEENEVKAAEIQALYGDCHILRQRLDSKSAEASQKALDLANTSAELAKSQTRIEVLTREETAIRRQAAEIAAASLENEGKLLDTSDAYSLALAENDKLRRQLAALNDNLWGMLRVNRELRVKRDGGAHVSEKLLSGGALNQSMSPHRSSAAGAHPSPKRVPPGGHARTPGF